VRVLGFFEFFCCLGFVVSGLFVGLVGLDFLCVSFDEFSRLVKSKSFVGRILSFLVSRHAVFACEEIVVEDLNIFLYAKDRFFVFVFMVLWVAVVCL
jgi:hypothetical protein